MMNKILKDQTNFCAKILILLLVYGSVSACQNNTSSTLIQDTSPETVETWGENRNIPEDYRPNLVTVRHHLQAYNRRGASTQFQAAASSSPRQLNFSLRDAPAIREEMDTTFLASYLMYENGSVVIDEISPEGRFGDLINNRTPLYSMSLGKSLAGYLLGHAICAGYIGSIDQTLEDWPLVSDTLIANATVRDVVNSTLGDQDYFEGYSEAFVSTGRNAGDTNIGSIARNELANSTPSSRRFSYGQFPANVALNYISFKTGHQFNSFINRVLRDHVGIASGLEFNGVGPEHQGVIQSNFKATRYDTLRIGIAILNDWNSNNCVGQYLQDVYANRVSKGRRQGDGYSRSYAGFFHTSYSGVSDTVMGMDGYGGIALLINFDEERVVYTHAAHRNYDYRQFVLGAISGRDVFD